MLDMRLRHKPSSQEADMVIKLHDTENLALKKNTKSCLLMNTL